MDKDLECRQEPCQEIAKMFRLQRIKTHPIFHASAPPTGAHYLRYCRERLRPQAVKREGRNKFCKPTRTSNKQEGM